MSVTLLQEALDRLDRAGDELVLDFSSVRRIEPEDLRALDALADRAGDLRVRVVLNAVNVDVYRVLKLVKLASRFSFH